MMDKIKIPYLTFTNVDALDSEAGGLMIYPLDLPAPLVIPFLFSEEGLALPDDELVEKAFSSLCQVSKMLSGSEAFDIHFLVGEPVPPRVRPMLPLVTLFQGVYLRLHFLMLDDTGTATYCYVPYSPRMQALDLYLDTHYPDGVIPIDTGGYAVPNEASALRRRGRLH